jgi:hypothetical protein
MGNLVIKSLSLSLRHQELTILPVRAQKGNGGTLPPGMPKLQRTKEKVEKLEQGRCKWKNY